MLPSAEIFISTVDRTTITDTSQTSNLSDSDHMTLPTVGIKDTVVETDQLRTTSVGGV